MTQQTSPPAASDKLDRDVFLVAGVVGLGAIMSILDITVVSVAIPTFQREFDATPAQVAWTMTGSRDAQPGYQIRTRSFGSSQRPSPGFTSNASTNSSRLRTMLARNSAGECGSVVSSWSICSRRRLVRQMCP